MGMGVVLGGAPYIHALARACMHVHTCTRTCGKHDNFMQMAAPIEGILGNSLWCHTCMHLLTNPHLHPPTPSSPREDPRNHSKFNSTWTNQDISILFEDLKSVETPPPMGGCIIWWVGGWVGWWVGSGQITKNLKIVDWIKIIHILFEDLWFVETPPPMGGCGWLGEWVGQWKGSGQMTKNLINLDLIKVIQFFLKIYDL